MEENNSKEINLLQLINSVIDWLVKVAKGALNLVGKLIKLSYKYKIVTGIILILSVAYGQYMARPSARVYNAEAMAMLYGSEAQTVKEVSKQLENTLATNNLISFAAKLSLPDSIAKNIVGFQSFYVIDYLKDNVADKVDFANNHSLTDTLNLKMKDRLYFQVKTLNISQVPKIQAALLNYFNKNSVMKTEFEQRKTELINRIQICNIESQRIDSLAKISYFKNIDQQLSFENNKLLLGDQRKQLFYDELLRLNDIRSYSEMRLADFKQPVDLPSDFVVNPNPLNGRGKYGVYSLIIGYALGLLIVLLLDN
ncbi:MAG TPA: hypothetical protein VFK73_10580, partial [Paludibacter sp.]|nr:hypothetical protein [Paludibacter sp.]